ncbi:MAG: NAD(P)H-hydrate dehydratase [Patescibacteria group bacterium]
MKILALPSAVLDRNSEFRGVLTRKLMENAGKQAAAVILQKFGRPKKVQIFCGSGGNGGDGFVVGLELLRKKIPVEVILAGAVKNQDAQFYLKKLPKELITKYSSTTKIDGALLVDALLGVGQRGKLRAPIANIITKLKNSNTQLTPHFSGGNRKIVSLDVPTGNLRPELVIAFHASKNSAREIVVPIGIPKSAEQFFGPGDVEFYFPRRRENSHKGENGRVVIVGGSANYLGAPLFAGLGALAAGVDLVDIFVPGVNFAATKKFSPNFLIHEFKGNTEFLTLEAAREILDFAREKNAAVVLGPGLGRNSETGKAVSFFAKNCRQPLVLDADALLPNLPKFISTQVVLTPHAAEFQRMPKNLNAVILKKGRTDAIISGERKRWNNTGNPILTVGGSGDTLAGLTGGLLAREVAAFEAAGLAAFLLGLAGERIALKSESTTPQALAKKIPQIIREILDGRKNF